MYRFVPQVSMHHSDDIAANTEFEYLKNIMFQVNRLPAVQPFEFE